MSPQEKAKQLVDRFYYSLPNNGYINEGINSCESRWKEAVTCAIIAVDEILEDYEDFPYKIQLGKEFWQEVKDELEITKTKINNNGTISN